MGFFKAGFNSRCLKFFEIFDDGSFVIQVIQNVILKFKRVGIYEYEYC